MITRVEISGFKTFTDFSVDLAPLSVIAGANASGKSNFLDALHILKGLATGKTLDEANGRLGSAALLFTNFGGNRQADEMTFAVELLLPLKAIEGKKDPKKQFNRLRYELTVANDHQNHQHFLITHERLSPIGSDKDEWVKEYLELKVRERFVRQPTVPGGNVMGRSFTLGPDSVAADHLSSSEGRHELTWLSSQTNGRHPQATALRNYFQHQHFVDLIAADNFSNFDDPVKNNSIILRELQNMVRERPQDIHLISLRVSAIANEIRKVLVEVDGFNRVSIIGVNKDGAKFISPHLSEGTLRTIALATLLHRDARQQTILLEEPENGIDPRALKLFIELLSDMVMDPDDPSAPLVQVICTTHSPIVLDLVVTEDQPQLSKGYLMWTVNKVVVIDEAKRHLATTAIAPVVPNITAPIPESRLERMTLAQAKKYINYKPEKVLSNG